MTCSALASRLIGQRIVRIERIVRWQQHSGVIAAKTIAKGRRPATSRLCGSLVSRLWSVATCVKSWTYATLVLLRSSVRRQRRQRGQQGRVSDGQDQAL